MSRGFLSGGLCLGGFCLGGFCPRTVLVPAFVKDLHIQLVAIVSHIRYSINIFHYDHRHVTLSTVNFQIVRET